MSSPATSLPTPEAPPSNAPERASILVVDDSPIDRRLAGRLVEKESTLRATYANGGAEALELLAQTHPAAVLTDLQMPGMDGLELVRAVREQYPTIPVILMTGNGSEEIAMEALKAGAASYVPKRALARDLIMTVEQVMNAAQVDRRQQRLLGSFTYVENRLALENDPSLVPALVTYLQSQITQLGVCELSERTRVGVALEEALLNGLYHGNLELSSDLRQDGSGEFERRAQQRRHISPYSERRLHVYARVTPAEATFVIRDEGPGFDPSKLPDPTDPANLEKASGRGLLLIQAFMDSVSHNSTGNEITLIKKAAVSR